MGYSESIKERLETLYKEPSIWEREAQEKDWTKIPKYLGKEIIGYTDFTKYYDFERIKNECEGNYRWFFEQLKSELGKEPTLYDYYCLYTDLLKGLTQSLIGHMFSCESEIEELRSTATLGDIVDAHEKEELKLDLVFNEYTENLDTYSDVTIKVFPKNTSDKEKGILNHLANKFLIKRELTPSGLLPLFGKNGTKRLLEEFYKYAPEYKDYQAFNFIKSSIETNLPDATLQNYCREVRKDTVKI